MRASCSARKEDLQVFKALLGGVPFVAQLRQLRVTLLPCLCQLSLSTLQSCLSLLRQLTRLLFFGVGELSIIKMQCNKPQVSNVKAIHNRSSRLASQLGYRQTLKFADSHMAEGTSGILS